MNFTEKMARYVISDMIDNNGNRWNFDDMVKTYPPKTLKAEVEEVARKHNKMLAYNCWDIYVCYAMAMADYPHSLDSDDRRKLWVVEYLTDVDGDDNKLFNYFF